MLPPPRGPRTRTGRGAPGRGRGLRGAAGDLDVPVHVRRKDGSDGGAAGPGRRLRAAKAGAPLGLEPLGGVRLRAVLAESA